MSNAGPASPVIVFGVFRLYPAQRLLLRYDEPIKLGGRAFDLLLALAERLDQTVTQKELLTKVWPGRVVEEVNLRFHVAALRRALDDGQGGLRHLINIPGRGYALSAEGQWLADAAPAEPIGGDALYPLPRPSQRIIGRGKALEDVQQRLRRDRFVSLVGPGGVGKTIVAVSLAHHVVKDFEGAVCFVELGPVAEPERLTAAVAAAFQLPVIAQDPLPELLHFLSDKRALVVLDSCEHLVEDVAALVQRLFDGAGNLHILATSREALRTKGETIVRLPPLETPPFDEDLSMEDARRYPAVELFLDRLAAAGPSELELDDEDTRIAVKICRHLGGIALAIELVASGAAIFGIRDTAQRLDSQMVLSWPGWRTAPARQRSLNATLDWSYSLLSAAERQVLIRLSAFAGSFTFEAGQAIGRGDLEDEVIFDALGGLLAKSLLSLHQSSPEVRYRLLDMTRTYARGKLQDAGEWHTLRRVHAEYYLTLLQAAVAANVPPSQPVATVTDLDEVRAALQWAFGDGDDALLGADLAANAAPLWLERALMAEARGWMARAAEVCIDSNGAADAQQLRIQMAYAVTELFTTGFTDETIAIWKTTLERAAALGDLAIQIRSHLILWGGEIRRAQYDEALRTAEQCLALVVDAPDRGDQAMAQWMVGHSLHHLGRFGAAKIKQQPLQRYRGDRTVEV